MESFELLEWTGGDGLHVVIATCDANFRQAEKAQFGGNAVSFREHCKQTALGGSKPLNGLMAETNNTNGSHKIKTSRNLKGGDFPKTVPHHQRWSMALKSPQLSTEDVLQENRNLRQSRLLTNNGLTSLHVCYEKVASRRAKEFPRGLLALA